SRRIRRHHLPDVDAVIDQTSPPEWTALVTGFPMEVATLTDGQRRYGAAQPPETQASQQLGPPPNARSPVPGWFAVSRVALRPADGLAPCRRPAAGHEAGLAADRASRTIHRGSLAALGHRGALRQMCRTAHVRPMIGCAAAVTLRLDRRLER